MTNMAAPSTESFSHGVATEVHQVTIPSGTAWFSASHAAARLDIVDFQAWQSEIQNGTAAMPSPVEVDHDLVDVLDKGDRIAQGAAAQICAASDVNDLARLYRGPFSR